MRSTLLLGLLALALPPGCDDDSLGEPCTPDTRRCRGDRVERCTPDGNHWETIETCQDDQTCVEGVCLDDSCPPGERQCAGDAVYVCAPDGQSWDREACPAGTSCHLGYCVECITAAQCGAGWDCIDGRCIDALVEITTLSLPDGTRDASYLAYLQAQHGVEPYNWSITDGALPEGLALEATTGAIHGFPAAGGMYDFTVSLADAGQQSDAQELSIFVAGTGLTITTPASLPGAKEGFAYETALEATGGTEPYAWMITGGALPLGLDLLADGRIAGVPEEVGDFTFEARVLDNSAFPETAAKEFNLTVGIAPLVITGDTVYDFFVSKIIVLNVILPYLPYSDQLTAQGGLKPYHWSERAIPSMLATSLSFAGIDTDTWGVPDGLSLADDGALSGTVTSTDDATTINIPVVNISVTGFFFYGGVDDSQTPAASAEAVYCIPTVPL